MIVRSELSASKQSAQALGFFVVVVVIVRVRAPTIGEVVEPKNDALSPFLRRSFDAALGRAGVSATVITTTAASRHQEQ